MLNGQPKLSVWGMYKLQCMSEIKATEARTRPRSRALFLLLPAFIVISIGKRMKNNERLRRAGPFEVSETTVSEIEEEAEYWLNAVLVGQEEVAELTERLKESDELIERLRTAFASGSSLGRGHA